MTTTAPVQIPIVSEPLIPGLLPGIVKSTDAYPAVDITDMTQSPQGSTKSYTIAQLTSFITSVFGLYTYLPVMAGTTTNLIATYNNGSSGIGATLKNSSTLAPFAVDGYTAKLNDRIVVKNQTSAFNNGYVLIEYVIGNTPFWVANFFGAMTVGATSITWSMFNLSPGQIYNWNTITGTSASLAKNNGYINTNIALTTYTLPALANVGDTYIIKGYGSGGWQIAQNSSQQIILGNRLSTIGITGYIASTNQYDDITLTCIVANTIFKSGPPEGIITVN